MGRSPGAKLFWRITGPLLLYWLISFAVKFICEVILILPHVPDLIAGIFPDGLPVNGEAVQLAVLYSEKVIEILLPYQVMVFTVGALSTVPLTAYLFLKDREIKIKAGAHVSAKAEPLEYLRVAGFGIAVCIALNCLSFMTELAFMDGEYIRVSQVLYSAGFLKELICLGILVPFAEELMYRGILFRRFREIAGFTRAALFASLLFAFSHGNAVQVIYTLILGMFLAYVYEKFGSVKAPVLLHIIVNITSIVLTESGGFDYFASDIIKMGFVTVLCAFLGSIMFVSIQRMNGKSDLPKLPEIK